MNETVEIPRNDAVLILQYLQRVEGLSASEALGFLQLNQRLYTIVEQTAQPRDPATQDDQE